MFFSEAIIRKASARKADRACFSQASYLTVVVPLNNVPPIITPHKFILVNRDLVTKTARKSNTDPCQERPAEYNYFAGI